MSFHLSGHTFRFALQENELSSAIAPTVPLECTYGEFHLSCHTFRFGLQENELFSAITPTVPLKCTYGEFLFEWLHL